MTDVVDVIFDFDTQVVEVIIPDAIFSYAPPVLPPAFISLSNTSMAENIISGAAIGELSVTNGTGSYTFTVISDPDDLFTIDSADLDKGGLVDYETATSHQVTIRADNGEGSVIDQEFTISVTNIEDVELPAAVSFSPADNATFVAVDADLVVTFNVTVVLGTGNVYLKKTSDNTVVEAWDVTTEAGSTAGKVEVVLDTKLMMHVTTDMPGEELYVVWDAGVVKNLENEDVAALSTTTTWSFTVGAFTLDALTPGAVYSFRKLVDAYAGDCVSIRATGDDNTVNFGFVDDEVDTVAIAAHLVAHGGDAAIVTWFDQSGNGIDITQATAANQPLFIASGINSLPTARFDGSNDTLAKASVASTFTNADETTIMGVAEQDGTQAQNILFSWFTDSTATVELTFSYDNVLYFDFGTAGAGGRVNIAQPSGWDDNPHIFECYRTTADSQAILVDGVSLVAASRADVVPATSTTLSLGSRAGTTLFKGDISEFFVLKTDIGSSNRGALRVNMAERYGITV